MLPGLNILFDTATVCGWEAIPATVVVKGLPSRDMVVRGLPSIDGLITGLNRI